MIKKTKQKKYKKSIENVERTNLLQGLMKKESVRKVQN